MTQTRKIRGKKIPWRGWKKEKPGYHQKTVMMKKCGKKCFLGPGKTFPVCKKNTCKISKHGVYAAYVRSNQYYNKTLRPKYKNISRKAKRLLIHLHAKR